MSDLGKWFDFRINLSHIAIIIAAAATVVGFGITMRDGIVQTANEFRQTAAEMKAKNELQDLIISKTASDMQSKKELQDLTIAQLRSEVSTRGLEESNSRTQIMQSITELQKLLTDIRIEAAGRKPNR